MTETERTFRKARMFGRLTKGGHMQVHEVFVGADAETAVATGILITALKQTSSSPWEETVSIDETVFPTVADALAAWRTK